MKLRITPEDVKNSIEEVQYYNFPDTMLIVCCITMKNGFNVTGESACCHPETFSEKIGKKIAHDKAEDKIWELLGYDLVTKMHAAECYDAVKSAKSADKH